MAAALPVLETMRPVRTLRVHSGPAAGVTLRTARASDVDAIHTIQQEWVVEGRLLPRTKDEIRAEIRHYVVAVEDGKVVGCAMLRVYDDRLAEVCALAVASSHHGRGVGRQLVERLVARAARRRVPQVLALTLEDGFFGRLGFERAPIGEFPQKIARDCASCARRSTCMEIPVVHRTHVTARS